MIHSLRNYHLLAVFLEGKSLLIHNWGIIRPASHLIHFFGEVFVTHTKRFDRENLIWTYLIGESPNVKGYAGRKRLQARFGEVAAKHVRGRNDPV